MFTVVYEDTSLHEITCITEYCSDHMYRDAFRRAVLLTVFDIESECNCHSSRAYIFFNSSMGDVRNATGFYSSEMLIMCNALITSMAHTDKDDNYIVNTWLTRDKDVMSHLLRSKKEFF